MYSNHPMICLSFWSELICLYSVSSFFLSSFWWSTYLSNFPKKAFIVSKISTIVEILYFLDFTLDCLGRYSIWSWNFGACSIASAYQYSLNVIYSDLYVACCGKKFMISDLQAQFHKWALVWNSFIDGTVKVHSLVLGNFLVLFI
jgi:hypothetical protein